MCDLLQVSLLFVAEFAIGEDFDIVEDNREASDPVLSSESAVLKMVFRVACSSEIALNWLGASTKSLRILLASSITAMKSPTLKPKLIVIQAENERRLPFGFADTFVCTQPHEVELRRLAIPVGKLAQLVVIRICWYLSAAD
jgi:hypothetical protein